MEKRDHNQKDNNPPIGLMGYIRSQERTIKEIDVREELLKPFRPPQTNTLYCGTELAEHLQALSCL